MCKEDFKIDKVPVTIEVDHNLSNLPTNLENRIIADIKKTDNRKKLVVSNDIEVNEYWLPEDNY